MDQAIEEKRWESRIDKERADTYEDEVGKKEGGVWKRLGAGLGLGLGLARKGAGSVRSNGSGRVRMERIPDLFLD